MNPGYWLGRARRLAPKAVAAARALGRLSPRERAVALEAFLTLLSTWISIRLLPCSTLERTTSARESVRSRRATSEETQLVCQSVSSVARNFVFPVRCVVRSVAIRRMLGRRGVDSSVIVGVRYDDGTIQGHAWVECGGHPLFDSPEVGNHFARVSPEALRAYLSRDGVVWTAP